MNMAKRTTTAKGRRRGRPPKPGAERMTEVLRVRTTTDLADALYTRALRERKSLADLAREILEIAVAPKKQPAEPGPTLGA